MALWRKLSVFSVDTIDFQIDEKSKGNNFVTPSNSACIEFLDIAFLDISGGMDERFCLMPRVKYHPQPSD